MIMDNEAARFLTEFFIYKFKPPLLWIIIILQYTTALCMMLQYKAQGRQNLGWEGDDIISRTFMLFVALWLAFRATCLIHEGSITANVVFLSLAMCCWRVNALRKYIHVSKRHAQNNVRQVEIAQAYNQAKEFKNG